MPPRCMSRARQGAARHSMTHPSNRGSVVVIGAGIVGAACAYRLQSLGFEVVLVDRGAPGEACSFGNAGRIATSLVTPKSVPGLLRKVPGMLLDRRHPLKTSAGFVLRNLAWCMRFARAGVPGEVARITDALHVLLSRGDAAIDRMAASAGAMDVIRTDGVLYVFQDPDLGEAARESMAESDRRGTPSRYVTGDQVRDIDPAIPASVTCGFHKPEERFVRSPIELTRRVAQAFAEAGGVLVRDEVVRLEARRGTLTAGALPHRKLRGGQGGHRGRSVVAAARRAARGSHPGRSRTRLPRGAAARRRGPEDRDSLRGSAGLDDADVGRTPGFEWCGACGRGRGAELETPRRGDRSGESALSGPGRHRSDPVDGSPALDPGLPAGRRRAPGAAPTSCSPPGTGYWGSPSRRSPRRSSATLLPEESPTSTWRRTGRIASDLGTCIATRAVSLVGDRSVTRTCREFGSAGAEPIADTVHARRTFTSHGTFGPSARRSAPVAEDVPLPRSGVPTDPGGGGEGLARTPVRLRADREHLLEVVPRVGAEREHRLGVG